jgi:DNA repair protein RecN (Recombination protein N)
VYLKVRGICTVLCELRVENLALIESLHLSFESGGGLMVLTGETGAGKSIMIRAIGLLAGARGSADWIRAGAERCRVEALFEVSADHHELMRVLEEGGFEVDSQIVIARTISAGGRSRLHINGSIATAKAAAEISSHLLEIAGQREHQRLLESSSQLDYLDTVGDLWPLRSEMAARFQVWREAGSTLTQLRGRQHDRDRRCEFLNHQINEIETAAPEPGEDEALIAERNRLKSVESLLRLSRDSLHLLAGPVADNLALVRKHMEQLAALDPGADTLCQEVSEYAYLADEHGHRLRSYLESLEHSPHRLETIGARLDTLQNLKRKYGTGLAEVLDSLAEAKAELAAIEHLDEQIATQQALVTQLQDEVMQRAESLSGRRIEAARALESAVNGELASLNFNKSRLEVRFAERDGTVADLRATGADTVEFYFAANPGEPARPLARIVSGGELSRLMLALKCILARQDKVETVIFDEVDAGVGGEAAEAVARKIRELAAHHQVICITHLPQIAARGTQHLRVDKRVVDGRTISTVEPLPRTDRVAELARMLAGETFSSQTLAWAEELLRKGEAAQ